MKQPLKFFVRGEELYLSLDSRCGLTPVARPDIQHVVRLPQESTVTAFNWSGFELPNFLKASPTRLGFGFSHYDYGRGRWNVPFPSGSINDSTSSSLWVGLDGDGTKDLVQAGTESDAVNYLVNGFLSVTFLTFFAWTEFLPQQKTASQITNFPVSAGDEMFVEVWIGNAGSGPDLSGAFGVFFLMNLTTGVSTSVYTPVGSTTVLGKEAVWILERPAYPVPASGIFGPYSYVPMLSNYGSAVMMDAYAGRSDVPSSGLYPILRSKDQTDYDDQPGEWHSDVHRDFAGFVHNAVRLEGLRDSGHRAAHARLIDQLRTAMSNSIPSPRRDDLV